jgi:hypothetical protein
MTFGVKVLIATLALASPAGAFELSLPADCILGQTCYIQQYADHAPGPTAQDFTCGALSYQGHDGTDFALPTRAAMAAGVNVLAAAPGTVEGIRDDIADFAPVEPGKDCGNGVLIDHGDGWQTQYCHMKQGSIGVRAGQDVSLGTVLGQIGQSGQAEFPHLHLSVRHNGQNVDPFAPEIPTTCGATALRGLWAQPLPYQPGGLLAIGISAAIPDFAAIKSGLPSPNLPKTATALVVWAYLFGSRTGDSIAFTLDGPEGALLSQTVALEKPQAQLFRAVGLKLKTTAWPAGRYTGTAKLIRNGAVLETKTIAIAVQD